MGTAVHAECNGLVGIDTVSFFGNEPGVNQFLATSAATLLFFQFSEIDTVNAQEYCEWQQNITSSMMAGEPDKPTGIVSAATTCGGALWLLLIPFVI